MAKSHRVDTVREYAWTNYKGEAVYRQRFEYLLEDGSRMACWELVSESGEVRVG